MMDSSDHLGRGAKTPGRHSAAPRAGPDSRTHFWIGVGVMAVLATVALVVLGAWVGSQWTRHKALGHMRRQEFTLAQGWLAWSARLAPGDHAVDVLKAACYRQLNQTAAWRKSLEEAVRKGATREHTAVELQLDRVRHGAVPKGAAEIGQLTRAGVLPSDLATAMLLGYLEQMDAASAKAFLMRMPEDSVDEAHREYLWGVYLRKQEDLDGAEIRFTNALSKQPSHELAAADLASLLEERCELARAAETYSEMGVRCGGTMAATLGLARVLRKLGRLEQARAVLSGLAASPDPNAPGQLELAQIALESGNYEEAERRFCGMPLEETTDSAILVPAAHALALRKRPVDAQRLITNAMEAQRRKSWIFELRVRVSINRGNAAAAEELRRLDQSSAPLGVNLWWGDAPEQLVGDPVDKPSDAAVELHRVHCSACHGLRGDGHGVAARNLFPRARDLRSGLYQVVSTLNGAATLEDVQQVLTRGMPGTSMPSFPDLSEAECRLLAEEVLRLRREGAREQMVQALREEAEEVEEAEVRRAVQHVTTPGERVRVPVEWPAPGKAAAKGQASYTALGCNKCHGDDGTGAGDQSLFDSLGEPSRPRDLVHEAFKGGREPEAIYARIAAGMPGTAHPASLNLPQGQLLELVDYVRSLAREPERKLTNHQRRTLASSRAYLEWLKAPPKTGAGASR